MGKRQIRIFRKKLLDHAFELLQQPSVQLVLRNRVVLTGALKQLSAESIKLLDLRSNFHTYTLEQVEEVIYDVESDY